MTATRSPEGRRSRVAGLGVLAIVGAILLTNGVWIARHWEWLRPIAPGDVAPPFELHVLDRDGQIQQETLALRTLRGSVVLVDFWAEWCKPCRRSIPILGRVHSRYRDAGFQLVSVKTDGPDLGRAEGLMRATQFPMLIDDGHTSQAYTVTTIPHLVLIDHLGVVRYVHRGGVSEAELVEQVETLLARRRGR